MKDSKFSKRTLLWAIIGAIAILAAALVGCILAAKDVIDVNPFLMLFMIMSLGLGLVFYVYAFVVKGGYEMLIGGFFTVLGVTLLLVAVKLKPVFLIVVIDVILIIIMVLVSMAVFHDKLLVERTDEKKDFKPYMETLKEQKEKEKADAENAETPEIKSFKDDKKD